MALLFALASTTTAALAQAVPTPQQLAPTREELDRSRPDSQAPRSARLTIDGDIERAPCALDSPAYASIRTDITEARFNNLQGMTAEELKASYAPLLGPDKPISTICTIRDAAATALRRKGYLAAVQVPVQKIENGVVKFEVLLARVVAIRVRGNAGTAEKTLAGYLSHLTEQKVFNRYVAERYLLLSRDMPGYEVRLALKPAGTAPGELVGEISVSRTPFEASASIQNFSARSSGRWSGALAAQYHGLLGADRVSASVSSTADFKEQQVVQLGYDTKLGHDGLTWAGNFTYAWSEPSIGAVPGFTNPKLTARTLFATGEVRYPWIRTQSFSLVGAAGLDYLNQTVTFNGIDITRDHLRVGFLRLDMDSADVSETRAPMWRASGSLELRQGFNIFGATNRVPSPLPPGTTAPLPAPSRLYGDPTATVVRFSASLEYSLGNGMWIAALPRAQYAFSPLLSFEQYSGGNFSIGRGYDPGSITGDSGLGSSFELRFPRVSPFPKANLALLPFTFVDVAWVWNEPVNRTAGISNPDRLVSVGAGVRALLDNRFQLSGTVAVPLEAAGLQTRTKNPRFLISLSSKLWPWDDQ